ncbi:BCCT family transporter [Marinitenerispora sediminis]|uniref:Glycine/betaine ABC transporter permease n=1 Tax=Marinitenerispora sediminis TaxID=1931232 RepID=A0A368TBT8_9ACTN|nr:BCCT family transporter [Marinitenerispora sediminis]RCV56652.1 glycine/betaine ABC transporter permease [Marinitenerispora sediminis]RCV61644.1 glycine/betaine ABC transporter permease [Marinitenerispora sediminis]RCV62624.1 glycine/betaine ABC transporter permease [Marinitenerispora sediminis]
MRPETTPRTRLGPVFWISVGVSALFVLWGVFGAENQMAVMSGALGWLTSRFGWVYLTVPVLLLGFLLFLALSRFGTIRLGADDDRPEFRTHSWIAMILGAVMGIGLISYGVAEPVSHFMAPPHQLAEPGSPEAAVVALQYSFYDWGLHAWAVFALFGLAFGYSTHRRGRRGLISAIFRPLLGRRADGPLGTAIDVFTVFATLFGTTTSLGLGALQIDNGLARLLGTPSGVTTQVVIIVVTTLLFTASAVSGVHRGIRYLSEGNMVLAGLLFAFVLLAGSTAFLVNVFFESVGRYLNDFLTMSLRGAAFGDLAWMQSWTYFMMAWWISWGAFVGVFLARISRGRTIRQFVGVVIGAPSAAFFAWFTVFGGSAIETDLYRGGGVAEATAADINNAFFALLQEFPLPAATSAAVVLLAALFFITGADANTYVLGMLTSEGSQRPRTPVLLLWGGMTGAVAVILLLSGGLQALQQTVIVSSAPFVLVIGGLVLAFWKDLKADPAMAAPARRPTSAVPEPAVAAGGTRGGGDPR